MPDRPPPSGRSRFVLNAGLALYLLGTGTASIFAPVPEIPAVAALMALALLNRQALNRPAWIIGSLVVMLVTWGLVAGWLDEAGALSRVTFLSAFLVGEHRLFAFFDLRISLFVSRENVSGVICHSDLI